MNLKLFAKNGIKLVKNNLPTILTGVALGGVVGTAFLAGKGSLEADRKLKELEKELGVELDIKEKAKATYKYYLPALTTGMVTIIAIIGANRISAKQLLAMTTAARVTEQSLVEHREAVEQVFGEKGLRKVDEKVNESVAARYFSGLGTIYETGQGSTLCCEGFLTGMLFHANREWVRRCVNEFNARLVAGEHLSYNDFLCTLIPGVDQRILPASGWVFGYNLDIKSRLLEIVEDSFLTQDSREPGYIFKLADLPLVNYDEYY